MRTQYRAFPLKHLIVMTADGKLDLVASKDALKSLAENTAFDGGCDVLLDLREVECAMSVTDIFNLAGHMALPNSALSTTKRIAVLVDSHSAGNLAFNHAQLLELCADNRGLNVCAFEDHDKADEWLNAGPSIDPSHIATIPTATPAFST